MKREVIKTEKAPKAIGPYEQALKLDGWVFTSGQIPLDPQTGAMVEGGIGAQTRQVLENLRVVLEAAGTSMSRVVKTTVYMTNLGDFQMMNEMYAEYFPQDRPVRSTVGVASLPRGALVEIDVIAQA
ncbi:MAG: RidA family protein [candidate division NC10 bacterium]|nr:RidA family protein [candidate division NC10 bacterium]MBI2116017.1 RidA family protein [candidate division NC10 bacterium]MBI2458838.1 RidA family protein [candidate division NC10 bacterium]MBI2563801.1 RidA family protein [candidate division NC10 bacterium]